MKNKILLILCIIFNISSTFADGRNYGIIIQRQSKQIQDLESRVLELEDTIEALKINLSRNASLSKNLADTSVLALGEIVDERSIKSILRPKSENILFKTELSMPQDKTDYDLALATLKDGDFESAEQQFVAFIKKYPSSGLQSNAIFWYAESFYRRGNFNKAAINYLQSYKKYPKASKAPDALLKLSYSLANLNKNKEACRMLEKLEFEFPQRSFDSIKRTNEAKSKFYCK